MSAFLVVHLGLSLLKEGIILLMRVSLKGRHSSSPSQQSRLRKVSRPRRPRRQNRHHSPSYAALVVPVFQSH